MRKKGVGARQLGDLENMGQLQALQNELKKLLFVQERPPVHSQFWGTNIPERLGVYRNNVHTNWIDTLDNDFPLTKKQFSEETWENLRTKFFIKHPPRHWELNTSVTPFVSFLKVQKVPAHVKELADYEWADLTTFVHAATPRKGMGVTNPTFTTRVFQHQIFFWVQDGAVPKKIPKQKPEVLIFFRDTKHTLHIEEAEPLMLLLLEHFRKPGANLNDLEVVREQLLSDNHIPLETVLRNLKEKELILL